MRSGRVLAGDLATARCPTKPDPGATRHGPGPKAPGLEAPPARAVQAQPQHCLAPDRAHAARRAPDRGHWTPRRTELLAALCQPNPQAFRRPQQAALALRGPAPPAAPTRTARARRARRHWRRESRVGLLSSSVLDCQGHASRVREVTAGLKTVDDATEPLVRLEDHGLQLGGLHHAEHRPRIRDADHHTVGGLPNHDVAGQ